jgi:DNA polymerase III epsilon subunit-like protein
MFLFFDTETTGLPKRYDAPFYDSDNWPRLVQLSTILFDKSGNEVKGRNFIICPDGFEIPAETSKIHGITTERAKAEGLAIRDVLPLFFSDLSLSGIVVGHNVDFDLAIVAAEVFRSLGREAGKTAIDVKMKAGRRFICTMRSGENLCKLPGKYEGKYKWPKLAELYAALFEGANFAEAHNSEKDVAACAKCFFEMKRRGIIKI